MMDHIQDRVQPPQASAGPEHDLPDTGSPAARTAHGRAGRRAFDLITALSMTVGRGPAARAIAGLAGLAPGDRLVDIGCGPGTAARAGARQCSAVTGVDPAPSMLHLGRWLSALRRVPNVTFTEGRAESLPLADASMSVAWALSSVHHWEDRTAGLAEVRRVLAPGGRVLLAERLTRPGARGHAAHGLTQDQATRLARDLESAGFTGVDTQIRRARRRILVVVGGSLPQAAG